MMREARRIEELEAVVTVNGVVVPMEICEMAGEPGEAILLGGFLEEGEEEVVDS